MTSAALHRGVVEQIFPPLCKGRWIFGLQAEKTEGLYRRPVIAFALLLFTPLFCYQKKSRSHPAAVPDGVPVRRIFNIPISPDRPDGSQIFPHR